MQITKYGNLNKVGSRYRIKVRCPECGTEVILDKDEYKEGHPVFWSYYKKDVFGEEVEDFIQYGREVTYECPMCGVKRTAPCYFHKLSWFYKSGIGKFYGRYRPQIGAWTVVVAVILGFVAFVIFFCIFAP